MSEILPDSRTKVTKGRVFQGGTSWVPVFCAACSKEGGLVTESCTFAFWLCRLCEDKHGHIAGTMKVPDSEHFRKMHEEQLEMAGRLLTHNELLQVVAEDCTPLATLIKEAK